MSSVADLFGSPSEVLAPSPPEFPQRDELQQLAPDFGRMYYESFRDADEQARRSLGAYIYGYDATSIGDGPSGTVVVLGALLSHLSDEQIRELATELAYVLGRYG